MLVTDLYVPDGSRAICKVHQARMERVRVDPMAPIKAWIRVQI